MRQRIVCRQCGSRAVGDSDGMGMPCHCNKPGPWVPFSEFVEYRAAAAQPSEDIVLNECADGVWRMEGRNV